MAALRIESSTGFGRPPEFAFGLAVVERGHQLGHAHSDVGERQVAAGQARRRVVDPCAGAQRRHRDADARRPPADGGGGDLVQLPDAYVAVGDDLALTVAPVLRGEKHCPGGIFDPHDLG
mgnify:CR=1 FL=1